MDFRGWGRWRRFTCRRGGLVRRWSRPRGNRPLGGRFWGPNWSDRQDHRCGANDPARSPNRRPPGYKREFGSCPRSPDPDLAGFVRVRAPSPNSPRTPPPNSPRPRTPPSPKSPPNSPPSSGLVATKDESLDAFSPLATITRASLALDSLACPSSISQPCAQQLLPTAISSPPMPSNAWADAESLTGISSG